MVWYKEKLNWKFICSYYYEYMTGSISFSFTEYFISKLPENRHLQFLKGSQIPTSLPCKYSTNHSIVKIPVAYLFRRRCKSLTE